MHQRRPWIIQVFRANPFTAPAEEEEEEEEKEKGTHRICLYWHVGEPRQYPAGEFLRKFPCPGRLPQEGPWRTRWPMLYFQSAPVIIRGHWSAAKDP